MFPRNKIGQNKLAKSIYHTFISDRFSLLAKLSKIDFKGFTKDYESCGSLLMTNKHSVSSGAKMNAKIDWIVETDDPDEAWLENFEKTGERVWNAAADSKETQAEQPEMVAKPDVMAKAAVSDPAPSVKEQSDTAQALAELDQNAIAEMLVQCRTALKLLKSSRSGHPVFADTAGSVIDEIDNIVPLLSSSRARVFSLLPQ